MIQKRIIIDFPIEDFRSIMKECVMECIRSELETHKPPLKEPPEYIGAKAAAKILKISLPTLTKYRRNSILKGYKLGSKICYKKHEIEKAFQAMSSIKHSRNES